MATLSDESGPIRSCVGCRALRPQTELHRCVFGSEDSIVIDRTAAGRGAWFCGVECFVEARRKRAFERAWRRSVPTVALDRAESQLTS